MGHQISPNERPRPPQADIAEYAPDCPEEYRCPRGHCTGNPNCPNSKITPERYPKLFETLGKMWRRNDGPGPISEAGDG